MASEQPLLGGVTAGKDSGARPRRASVLSEQEAFRDHYDSDSEAGSRANSEAALLTCDGSTSCTDLAGMDMGFGDMPTLPTIPPPSAPHLTQTIHQSPPLARQKSAPAGTANGSTSCTDLAGMDGGFESLEGHSVLPANNQDSVLGIFGGTGGNWVSSSPQNSPGRKRPQPRSPLARSKSQPTPNVLSDEEGNLTLHPLLRVQKIHEDAVNHIRQGLQLEKQRDGAVLALTEYELGVGLLQQALSQALTKEQRENANDLFETVRSELDMARERVMALSSLKSPKTVKKSPTSAGGVLELEPQFNLVDLNSSSNPLSFEACVGAVSPAAQVLQSFFGFQLDSARCQREHVILLLVSRAGQCGGNIELASKQLHEELFKNQRKWSAYTRCEFASFGPAEKFEVWDIMLYFLIWGEAANLKHMPEAVCWLYQTMSTEAQGEDLIKQSHHGSMGVWRERPAGHFLENVICPMYKCVAAGMKLEDRRNYDDMNEVFWSPRHDKNYSYDKNDSSKEHVSTGLEQGTMARKTFNERRSILSAVLAAFRIFKFKALLAACLVTIAYFEVENSDHSRRLSHHVHSGWQWKFCRIAWVFLCTATACDAFQMLLMLFGGAMTSSMSLLLFFPRIILVAAVSFFACWLTLHPEQPVFSAWHNDLSKFQLAALLAVMVCQAIPILYETLECLVPSIGTSCRKSINSHSNRKFWKNLLHPNCSLTYVGNDCLQPCSRSLKGLAFWVALLTAKSTFSYYLQIKTLMEPSIELVNHKGFPLLNGYDDWFSGDGGQYAVLVTAWLPIALIFFMDTQIWYQVFVAVIGCITGWWSHIGEVRSFNMMVRTFHTLPTHARRVFGSIDGPTASDVAASPVASPTLDRLSWRPSVTAATSHLSEMSQPLVNGALPSAGAESWLADVPSLAPLWNEMVHEIRTRDLLSNKEVAFLVFRQRPLSVSPGLPIFLLAGEVTRANQLAVSFSKSRGESSANWWRKQNSNNRYMLLAVEECSEICLKLGDALLGDRHRAACAQISSWMQTFSLEASAGLDHQQLPALSAAALKFAEAFIKANDQYNNLAPSASVGTLTGPLVAAMRGLLLKAKDAVQTELPDIANALHELQFDAKGWFWDKEYCAAQAAAVFGGINDLSMFARSLKSLISTSRLDTVPANHVARDQLCFFANSLQMDMPTPPPVHGMKSWSVLTPYYSEDVIYSDKQLDTTTEDDSSMLFYLQMLLPDEWTNFLERVGVKSESDLITNEHKLERRLWASYRGQTLARTIRGVMCAEEAVMCLSRLCDNASLAEAKHLASYKFSYVVSCQIYGKQAKNNDQNCQAIDLLMHRYKNLRIAYIDEKTTTTNAGQKSEFFSVLVKSGVDEVGNNTVVEVYRIKLPGMPIIGEGKPENQNHAIIFTRGENLQALDMNQDWSFQECLKMRNLLQEFAVDTNDNPTIVGFREDIFTAGLSSLATFMALQETSFVTIGQRVLTSPLDIRLHYGHPDVFSKLFVMTSGGMSKASKGSNLSEDIFAGYNVTARGGRVGYCEYITCGKGRDTGMGQIYKFEAKLAQGNAEQCITRDFYRLGNFLSFSRLLSFFFGHVGFYILTTGMLWTIFVFLYLNVLVSMAVIDPCSGDHPKLSGNTCSTLSSLLNVQWAVQIGFFNGLPLLATRGLQNGFRSGAREFGMMLLTGGPFFFLFHMQSKAHYFTQTLIYGGAKYRATGRGFMLQHESFDEMYRFYYSSHFAPGMEMLLLLILWAGYASWENTSFILSSWSIWLIFVAWVFSPFFFNPLGFVWDKTIRDAEQWWDWMQRKSLSSDTSWIAWWKEEETPRTQGSCSVRVIGSLMSVKWLLLAMAATTKVQGKTALKRFPLMLIMWLGLLVLGWVALILFRVLRRETQRGLRGIKAAGFFALVGFVYWCATYSPDGDALSVKEWFDVAFAAVLTHAAVCQILLGAGVQNAVLTYSAKAWHFIVGLILFAPVFILSLVPFFQNFQTYIMFNAAYSRGLEVAALLQGRRMLPASS